MNNKKYNGITIYEKVGMSMSGWGHIFSGFSVFSWVVSVGGFRTINYIYYVAELFIKGGTFMPLDTFKDHVVYKKLYVKKGVRVTSEWSALLPFRFYNFYFIPNSYSGRGLYFDIKWFRNLVFKLAWFKYIKDGRSKIKKREIKKGIIVNQFLKDVVLLEWYGYEGFMDIKKLTFEKLKGILYVLKKEREKKKYLICYYRWGFIKRKGNVLKGGICNIVVGIIVLKKVIGKIKIKKKGGEKKVYEGFL